MKLYYYFSCFLTIVTILSLIALPINNIEKPAENKNKNFYDTFNDFELFLNTNANFTAFNFIVTRNTYPVVVNSMHFDFLSINKAIYEARPDKNLRLIFTTNPPKTYEQKLVYNKGKLEEINFESLDKDSSQRKQSNVDYWINRLSFLSPPVQNAKIPYKDSRLPNAPRTYRNGYHEGIDYFYDKDEELMEMNEPVFSSAKGTVIRADHDYQELAPDKREDMLKKAEEADNTPPDILDMLRGKQVWIRHEDGIVTRYAHLNKICNALQAGDKVESGQYIGGAGNSGTSSGAQDLLHGVHLHFEIWLDDKYYGYFGYGLEPGEIRAILYNIY